MAHGPAKSNQFGKGLGGNPHMSRWHAAWAESPDSCRPINAGFRVRGAKVNTEVRALADLARTCCMEAGTACSWTTVYPPVGKDGQERAKLQGKKTGPGMERSSQGLAVWAVSKRRPATWTGYLGGVGWANRRLVSTYIFTCRISK